MSLGFSRKWIAAAAIGCLFATPAFASPWYGGLNLGLNSTNSYGSTLGVGFYGGYRLLNVHIWRLQTAVEGGFNYFGSYSQTNSFNYGAGFTTQNIKTTEKGFDLAASVVFTYPVTPKLGAYARGGVAYNYGSETTSYGTVYFTGGGVAIPGYSTSGSSSGIDPLIGIGVNYDVTPHIGLRGEFRYTLASFENVTSFLFGANYRF